MDLASACIFILYSYVILIVAIVCKGCLLVAVELLCSFIVCSFPFSYGCSVNQMNIRFMNIRGFGILMSISLWY